MGDNHVGDRECDGDWRHLLRLDLAGLWGDAGVCPSWLMLTGLQLRIKGIPRSVWLPGSVGCRRVRGEAGYSHRQSRMLVANKVILSLLVGQ